MARTLPDFSEQKCREFIAAADPHQWMLSAADHHEQAIALHRRRGLTGVTCRGPVQTEIQWDGVNRSTFLLAALALENAIKAFLVYENAEWLKGGRIDVRLRSHKLTQLAQKSHLIPNRDRDEWVLAAFEDGNESWMRYPCGLHADDVSPQRQMESKLWLAYRRVMRGYGKKLTRMLSLGWTDPYGGRIQWTFGWNYFD